MTQKLQNLLLGFAALLVTYPVSSATAVQTATYVGRTVCAECHSKEVEQWTRSHHDLAMQEANDDTVLGDFVDAKVTVRGVTSSFHRRDGRFLVETEGPDGKRQEYVIRYTFGVYPLQQYLIEFPGGRLQALSLAWDSRPATEGGQRWFHLYPDERIAHDDELHWTKPSQNWNSMCAECHSTNLQKNYDADSRSFSTTWSEIDVSCEACHGPGSNHASWARKQSGWEAFSDSKGMALQLDERKDVAWQMNPETGTALRNRPRSGEKEIEMCARCHSRRSPISKEYRHEERLGDHYRPRLLDEGMYFADGQMDDEVYVYGSFLQSRMYHAGVTCSDCHDPHSTKLRAPGNGVCLQCHLAAKFDRPEHHFHQADKGGDSCAECHMPPRTYMVVDPRHDHSMRIPRPDLSTGLGTPNACNTCHTDRDAKWAAEQFKKWYPNLADSYQNYAPALHASRGVSGDAEQLLAALIRDPEAPAIARATAVEGIMPLLGRSSIDALQLGLSDDDPLVRMATAGGLHNLPTAWRVKLAFAQLQDPVRAVRIEAAQALADIPPGPLTKTQRAPLDKALAEYVEAQQAMAERPEAQVNLGNLHAAQNRDAEAAAAFRTAIELNSRFIPAYLNLADLQRSLGQEKAVEATLKQALQVAPENADLQHVLGLSLVRQKRIPEAVKALGKAARDAPDNPRYSYVYAIALNSSGQPQQALAALRQAQARFPGDADILRALVAISRDQGDEEASRHYQEKLRHTLGGQRWE